MSALARRRRVRGLLALWALGVVAAVAPACGLPKDSTPREVADDKVPFGLLGPGTTTQSDQPVDAGAAVQLYFIDGSRLRRVNRSIDRHDVRIVLDELVQGVASTDPGGLTTAIPKDTKVLDTQIDGDTLVVTLSHEMLNVQSTEQRNAFAQFVYTAADLGVGGVRFRVIDSSGNAQDVQPATDQGPSPGPVKTTDYAQEAPRS